MTHDPTSVASSWVKSVSWSNGILTVATKHSKTYRYSGVPGMVWMQLQASPSKGQFINANIKGKYKEN